MRQEYVTELQGALADEMGEPVEVLDAADAVTWSGVGIPMVPADVLAGGELTYIAGTTPVGFPESLPLPPVPIGARLRWRGSIWHVDGVVSADESMFVVLLLPA